MVPKKGKLEKLKNLLQTYESVVVAFSGGVDSTFLSKVAFDTLKDKALAVTATSSTYPERELEEAKSLARKIGIRHTIIESEELDIPGFNKNPTNRCYYCKGELFGKLKVLADEKKLNHVLDGANFDDNSDYRPGATAAAELKVKSPLKECGFTKEDIRRFSKDLGLPTWNKPAFACLASRFPYGSTITKRGLQAVDQAESFIRSLGFEQVRVRHHDQIARIEIGKADMEKFFKNDTAEKVSSTLKKLGFFYVVLDIDGYRTGSMNLPIL